MTNMIELREESNMEVDLPANTSKLSRGEKSRIAAKNRRDKEQVAMNELIDELPVSNEVLNKMDKAAVVKLAISFIKIKHFVQKDLSMYGNRSLTSGHESPPPVVQKKAAEGQLMLEALNGFLIFVSKKGTVKFISNTVTEHLGLKQEQMIGRNVMEYVHINDQQDFHKHFKDDKGVDPKKLNFQTRPTGRLCDEPQRVFYLRMKFNLPKPGTKTKQTGHLLVQWSGKMKRHLSTKSGQCVTDGLLCICRPMQTTPLLEIRMDGNMFMSRHDLGMTFTFCDTRIITLIGYEPNELVGKTAYHFHNPIDAPKVSACHQNLIVKGTSVSKYYRFLGKNDNWVWLQTRATIIYNTANKPQYIVCMNYVISEEEGERYLMLEEHQHANKQTENTIITLPDNQHYDPVCHPPDTMGPRIVELEEDHLVETARFPSTDTAGQPMRGVMVTATDNAAMCDTEQMATASADGMVYQTVDPLAAMSPDVDTDVLDLNAAADSPETSTSTLSNNGSPQSALSADLCSAGLGLEPQPMNGYNQPLNAAVCGANFNNSDSDLGYESANSPYSAHYSPQIVSPAGSTDRNPVFGGDYVNGAGYIQGQNCQLASAYNSGPNMAGQCNNVLEGDNLDLCSEDTNMELSKADKVLDSLLKNFSNQENMSGDFNIAAIFSTIESLTSQTTEPPVSTFVQSPGTSNTGLPQCTSTPSQNSTVTEKKSSSSSVLRNILTMPEKDLPAPTFGLKFSNGTAKTCANQPDRHSMSQACNGAQQNKFTARKLASPQTNNGQIVSAGEGAGYGEGRNSICSTTPARNNDIDSLCFSGIPDDISDLAMQYLDDVMDMQAQSVISDIQNNDGSFMDTSDDLTKVLLTTLENTCGSGNMCMENDERMADAYNAGTDGIDATIPTVSSSHQQHLGPVNSQYTTNPALRNTDNLFLNGNGSAPINCSPGASSHDHVYHQSVNGRLNSQNNRSRSQKIPENGMSGCYRQARNCSGSSPYETVTQTRSSEYCLSELERHLRNKREEMSRAQNAGESALSTSPKPFLEQLLTGELSKDRYMKMEQQRYKETTVLPK